MIRLPKLMLGDNLPQLIRIAAAITDEYSPIVECNAERLVTAEPVALCILAASFGQLESRGQLARVRGLRPEVRENLERLNVLADWLRESSSPARAPSDSSHSVLRACRVESPTQAEQIANALSREIAAFIPSDDVHAIAEDDPALTRYRVVERPLHYLITELLDNSMNHGKAGGFSHARAWVAAQYFRTGDLLRVAVVDNGRGFLQSLESHPNLTPKSHENAIRLAFRPFVSCFKDVGVFSDATHQGLGLTICRDLCLRANGDIGAASGSAWVTTPAMSSERSIKLTPGYQGSIVMMTLHRRAITPGSLGDILRRYQPNEDLPARLI
jgi:hypothetical protein